jgi:hypothetical protein
MKRYTWQISLGIVLIILSVLVYLLHYIIFRDPHHIFIYLIGDIAFVFIEVLLVTLVIHSLLEKKARTDRLEKLNMLIGAFFSEVGTNLLIFFSDGDPQVDKIRNNLLVTNDWSNKAFSKLSALIKKCDFMVEIKKMDLVRLQSFLKLKRDFLLRLLENPNLLEHETFTDLLRAVFHLTEELDNRKDVKKLPDTDYQHLAGDIKRIYVLLVDQWIDYMQYLKNNYPFLFSLAMRKNPFDENASIIVT